MSLHRWCRSSIFLCRRWWTTWRTPYGSWISRTEVPKISCSPCPSRSLVPETQSAEQLVEVPTVLSPLRFAEQIVGTPVPHGRGQGSIPRQGSPASGKRISERIVEQIVVFPEQTVEPIVDTSPGDGCGLGSSSSAGPADEDFTGGGFALFPMEKSAECRAGGECAAGWARQLIQAERSSNGSCRRARELRRFHGVDAVA